DGSTLTISANVVPQIAESIKRRPIHLASLDNWEYLWTKFALADDLPSETETASVDLLIGNDYYLDLILPQKIEIHSGLYLLGSILGWILSGRTSEGIGHGKETSMLILTYENGINKQNVKTRKWDIGVNITKDNYDNTGLSIPKTQPDI
ncbi:MAG: hypothetical protein AB2693_19185, partial [Candidatus Thiodiazotropha sp.]